MQQDLFNALIEKYLAGKASEEEIRLLDEYYTRMGRKEKHVLNEQEAVATKSEIFTSLQSRLHSVAGATPARVLPMRNKWWMAAAAIVAMAGAGIFFLQKEKKTGEGTTAFTNQPAAVVPTQYKTISNTANTIIDTLLPDGTHVWLNKNTSITYPEVFANGERLVEMKGEAYFDVVHNAAHPFRVKAGDAVIEDIGTRFNVVYVPGKPVKVTLVDGIVKVNQVQLSTPGEQYYDGRITRVDLRKTIAWIDSFTEDKIITFAKFPSEQAVSLEAFMTVEDPKVNYLYMLNDTTLVTYQCGPHLGDYFFNTYSLNSKRHTGSFLKSPGPGGVTQASFSGIYSRKNFWAYDFSAQHIITTKLTDQGDDKAVKSYRLADSYYDIQLMDSFRIVGNGARDSNRELQEIDLGTGKEMADYGDLEPTPKGLHISSWKDAHQSFTYLKPSEEKVAIAHRFTDKVKIFDRRTHRSILIKGPENFAPDYKEIVAYGTNFLVMMRTEKTRMAFMNGAVTDRYLFLLYSGLPDEMGYVPESKTRSAGQYVYVYDWDGQPVKKIKLDRLVTSITASDDNSTLYLNHNNADSKTIYKVKTGL